jgi:hypothetical protein
VQRPEKINLHDLAVDADVSVHKSTALGYAGIVDQDIDAAVMIDNLLNNRCAFFFTHHVASVTLGIDTVGLEFVGGRFNSGFIHVQQYKAGTFPGVSVANGGTYSTGSTGDNDHFVSKVHVRHSSFY